MRGLPARTPLSVPAFRRVWLGTTVSAAGDAASWIAMVSLSLSVAHASLALLVVLYTAPVAVGGMGAGWALDRFDRRRLMIADSMLRAAVFGSIPLTIIVAQVSATQLYAVAAVYGLLKMVSLAGFPSLIPLLVPESQLEQANALEGASFGLASFAGAAAAGLGVATIGAAYVVTFDAISYLILAVSLLTVGTLIRPLNPPVPPPVGAATGSGVIAVLRLTATNPVLRNTTIMFALFNVGEGTLLVFLPHRAASLGLGSGAYGYLVAASTGGELAAAAFLVSRPWRHSLRTSIVVAQLTAAATVLALSINSTTITVLALIALGAASAPMTAWAQTLRMRLVPAEMHGRLFALLRTTMQATPPMGAALAAVTLAKGTTITVLAAAGLIGIPAAVLGPGLLKSRVVDQTHYLDAGVDPVITIDVAETRFSSCTARQEDHDNV